MYRLVDTVASSAFAQANQDANYIGNFVVALIAVAIAGFFISLFLGFMKTAISIMFDWRLITAVILVSAVALAILSGTIDPPAG